MEYTIKFTGENNTQLVFNLRLTDEQLRGIITLYYLYSYDKYIDGKGKYPDPNFIITSITGVDIESVERESDLRGGHTYNEELIPLITYNDTNINGYEILYRLTHAKHPGAMKDVILPGEKELNFYINRNLKSRYFAIMMSKYDVAFKQFNTSEYIQGFMSMAKWLQVDYDKYIKYIFDGPNRVLIV